MTENIENLRETYHNLKRQYPNIKAIAGALKQHKITETESELYIEFELGRIKDKKLKGLIDKELEDLFEPENAEKWWNMPNKALSMDTPKTVFESGCGEKLLALLKGWW